MQKQENNILPEYQTLPTDSIAPEYPPLPDEYLQSKQPVEKGYRNAVKAGSESNAHTLYADSLCTAWLQRVWN